VHSKPLCSTRGLRRENTPLIEPLSFAAPPRTSVVASGILPKTAGTCLRFLLFHYKRSIACFFNRPPLREPQSPLHIAPNLRFVGNNFCAIHF
jgi:hypothetical protein